MNPLLREPTEWSASRWTLTILAVFAGHLGFLFAFSKPAETPKVEGRDALEISVLIDSLNNARWLDATRFDDPAVFALGHGSGFSGDAWNSDQGAPAEAQSWSAELSFLAPAIDDLGMSFVTVAGMPGNSDAFSSRRRIPPIESQQAPSAQVHRTSSLVLSPGLRRIGLVSAPEISAMASAESLRDSLVEVDVDRSGRVFSCRIANDRRRDPVNETQTAISELQEKADQMALNYARQMRFGSRQGKNRGIANPEVDLLWGRLRFQWGYRIDPQPTGVERQ